MGKSSRISDNLHVTVAIPTYKTRNTIFKLLYSLQSQSYKNFSIMLVYKPWSGCNETLGRAKEYSGLDVRLIKQDNGLFEEALNTIYRKADGDIVMHTDDDAYVSKDWIKDHVGLHKKHKGVGLATGIVDESTLPEGAPIPFFTRLLNAQKWRMNKHTIIDTPIDGRFKDYGMYIGRSGMLVDTGKRYNMIKTFKQHGVNMSWKRDALRGFKLPGYTKMGGRNESAATLEVLARKFTAVWFDRATVYHPLQRSDSRGTSLISLPPVLPAESVVFSYYVSRMYNVDLDILKRRTEIDEFMARLMTMNQNRGYSIGYNIAVKAIKEKWAPKQVRQELISALSR